MTDITFAATIAGKTIPVHQIECTGSSYGSVGSARMTTSIAALNGLGIDLFPLTSSGGGSVDVTIDVVIGAASRVRLFGGEYVSTEWAVDDDAVHLHARSWAGVLTDQKRVLTKIGAAIIKILGPLAPGQVSASGVSNQNQSISMIVTSIADEFGFTPVLNLSSGNNPTIGTLYGSADQSYMPVPQSLWSILNQLARDTGYVVYDTPQKELVFGEPGAGLPTIQIGYKYAADGVLPCRRLRPQHHPRRNGTFRVLVISYDAAKAQSVVGRASYVGSNYAGSQGLAAGLATGTKAASADTALGKLNKGTNQIPLYTFRLDGLTQDQANTQAAAIATDIAKRELILAFEIDGLPSILPTQKITLAGNDLPQGFVGPTFYTSGYTHTINVPKGHEHSDAAGFLTRIKALNIPTEALASETAG